MSDDGAATASQARSDEGGGEPAGGESIPRGELVPVSQWDVWESSPIALLTRDQRTHALLDRLQAQRQALEQSVVDGTERPVMRLHVEELAYAQAQWEAAILRGEQRLYDLATLLARRVFGTNELEFVARMVAGPEESHESGRRIVIEETVSRQYLKRVTDHTLATRMARRYQWRGAHTEAFRRLWPRASHLELRPLASPEAEVLGTKVLTRVKINDQIWNKVCDALFEVDRLMQRDKILNRASRYIKDVFGIKLVTVDVEASRALERRLNRLEFDPEELIGFGVFDPDAVQLTLIERKDYLSSTGRGAKATGWAALKNVYRWAGQVFELQLQTESNHHQESQHLSETSHRTFEQQRRHVRRQLDATVPFYREFRHVLKALFKPPTDSQTAAEPEPLPEWIEVVG